MPDGRAGGEAGGRLKLAASERGIFSVREVKAAATAARVSPAGLDDERCDYLQRHLQQRGRGMDGQLQCYACRETVIIRVHCENSRAGELLFLATPIYEDGRAYNSYRSMAALMELGYGMMSYLKS